GDNLQECHAVKNLSGKWRGVHRAINQIGSADEIEHHWDDTEDNPGQDWCVGLVGCGHQMSKPRPIDPENLIEISVNGKFYALRVPCGGRPKPHPTRAANESADHDHCNPQ